MIEPLTEEVEVLLINGETRKVRIKKYLSARERDQVLNKLTEGIKIRSGQKEFDLDAARGMSIFSELAEKIWYDKNTSLDDVEGESLQNVISERFSSFLGRSGFSVEIPDNKGSRPE